RLFDQYSIEWLKELDGQIDFINGFIEVYGDPLGMKGSWEGLVEYKDIQATKRAQLISDHAQWFEDHSPIDPRFRKPVVKGVTANVICAAMLGGDEYPSTAIGINLPNADWIRAQYGSKSITISNITEAYDQAAKGNGFKEEFIDDERIRHLIEKFGDVCDNLHTDLHECLGHGSGQLLPGTDANALKSYGNTIEEARADLFGLYYMADEKMVELGLLPDAKAYQAHYYTYILNGLMTQLTRINLGNQIEEAHMRNRALIARWVYEHSKGIVSLVRHNDKTYLRIYDYQVLRSLFAQLLAEIQRIKSEGDYDKARELVEKYAVKINRDLHEEIIARYKKLNIAPYKGFINPWLKPVIKNDEIVDIEIDYTEPYSHQMLRYSSDFGFL
ncbi:MAG: dihydrofolate reductase, partial [Prevotella sp.]|nr:dihydrofolate reductase [Prevotella sp.]